jgi:hypothetical protein
VNIIKIAIVKKHKVKIYKLYKNCTNFGIRYTRIKKDNMEYNGHKIQLDKVLGSICMNKYNYCWLMPIKN